MATLPQSLWVGLGAAVVASGAAIGCATVLGIEPDRYYQAPDEGGSPDEAGGGDAQDAGPVETAPVQPPGWACLNDPVPATPSGNIDLHLNLTDVSGATTSGATGPPIAGAEVHACDKLDLTCTGAFDSVMTDDAGVAALSIPGGFDGYYEVHAQSFTNAVLSRPPLLAPESQQQGMARISLLQSAGALASVTQDPTKSIAIVTVEDCSAGVAAGVVFTVGNAQPDETVVYLVNNLPSQSGTETDSVSGSALVFNVPVGTLTVTASFADTKAPIRTVTTIGRDNNWVTYVQIRPDQATIHFEAGTGAGG
jgi:hypothetical protein